MVFPNVQHATNSCIICSALKLADLKALDPKVAYPDLNKEDLELVSSYLKYYFLKIILPEGYEQHKEKVVSHVKKLLAQYELEENRSLERFDLFKRIKNFSALLKATGVSFCLFGNTIHQKVKDSREVKMDEIYHSRMTELALNNLPNELLEVLQTGGII